MLIFWHSNLHLNADSMTRPFYSSIYNTVIELLSETKVISFSNAVCHVIILHLAAPGGFVLNKCNYL